MTPEIATQVALETGEATPAVDFAPETALAMVAQADAADFPLDETQAGELTPVEDEEMPPPAKKSNRMIILLAAVFVLAIAVFAVVFFVFGKSPEETATYPPITPRTPPAVTPAPTTPATAPATTPATAPPATPMTVPATPPPMTPTATAPVTQPAVVAGLPVPGPPPFATAIQATAPVADIFAGGPPPPKIAKLRLKNIRMAELSDALSSSRVEVSVTHGIGDDEVLIVGMQKEIDRAKAIKARLDVEPPPQIIASALNFPFPTPTIEDQDVPPMTVIPVAPPPGRNAGWIYNNVNGQVYAIFESRSGAAYRVKVGDTVDGMQVISISPDMLVLRDARGQEYNLRMQGAENFQTGRSVTATPTAVAGSPAMPAWRK